jgi:hypothetical protein
MLIKLSSAKLLFMPTIILLFILSGFNSGWARDKTNTSKSESHLLKPMVRDIHPSRVANLWCSLNNRGFFGWYWPSFEWPAGSGNNYLFVGALWIAGIDDEDNIYCTTAAWTEEFAASMAPEDTVRLFSADDPLFNNRPNVSGQFKDIRVSAEDTYAEYTDLDPREHEENDTPLGVKVIERTYKWKAAYNHDFFIFDYQVINIGPDRDEIPDSARTLRDVYIAIFIDADISSAAGQWHWLDDLPAYYKPKQISYMYDGDDPFIPGNDTGADGLSEGYLYARLLKAAGGTPLQSYTDPHSHAWWTIVNDPLSDVARYTYMSTPGYAGIPSTPFDLRFLQTAGPFTMEPGDTVNIVWAMGVGDGLEGVITDSDWAKRIFDAGYVAFRLGQFF